MDTSHRTQSASSLVHEYLARNDSLGYFAGGPRSNDDWLMAIAECPGHQGGTDVVALVVDRVVNSISAGRDTARFQVRAQAIGLLEPTDSTGMRFVARRHQFIDTVTAVNTPFGWRLSGQVGELAMRPASAIAVFHLGPEEQARIDSALAAAPSGSRP